MANMTGGMITPVAGIAGSNANAAAMAQGALNSVVIVQSDVAKLREAIADALAHKQSAPTTKLQQKMRATTPVKRRATSPASEPQSTPKRRYGSTPQLIKREGNLWDDN
jgi:hypothetical protein